MFKNLYWTEWGENPSRGKCVVGSAHTTHAQSSDTVKIKRVLVQWARSRGVGLVTCLRVNSEWFIPLPISLQLWLLMSVAGKRLLLYLRARWKLLTCFAASERRVVVLTTDSKGSISERAWTTFTLRNQKSVDEDCWEGIAQWQQIYRQFDLYINVVCLYFHSHKQLANRI